MNINEITKVLINASVSFLVLFVISRIMGKKKIAQLDLMDYVVAISIGSIASEMATSLDTPMYLYIISMTIYLVFDLLISCISRKANFLKKLFRGQPLFLIDKGKINYKNLKKSKLDVNELYSLCREKDIYDINLVAYAIFETNGQVSIIPKGDENNPSKNGEIPPLTTEPICDGKIVNECLKQLGKDKEWLCKKLDITKDKQIKNIMLATYYADEDKFMVHYKKENNGH